MGSPLAGFGVSVRFDPATTVIGVAGELDPVTAPQLAAIFDAVIGQGSVRLVLDLAECSFMSAAGLRVIASGAEVLGQSGGGVTVRSASPMVSRLLDITGLSSAVVVEQPGPVLVRIPGGRSSAVAPGEMAGYLKRAGAIPAADDVIDCALLLVVGLAHASVGGADGVSVSMRRHGRLVTVAASDQTVSDMDAGQYSIGEGPCVEASTLGHPVHSASLESESRWPEFTPRARALGINSILSTPLRARSRPAGALNIYSRTQAVFGPSEQGMASTFATHASKILGAVGSGVTDEELGERITEALAARESVALAQGVVMERERTSPDQAYATMRRLAVGRGQTMRALADDLVASTRRPRPQGSSPSDTLRG